MIQNLLLDFYLTVSGQKIFTIVKSTEKCSQENLASRTPYKAFMKTLLEKAD